MVGDVVVGGGDAMSSWVVNGDWSVGVYRVVPAGGDDE